MPIKNQTTLERGLRSLFQKTLSDFKPNPILEEFVMPVPSDKEEEKYAHLGNVGNLEHMKDSLTFQGVKDYSYTLKNRTYAKGIEVKEEEIEDDQVGGAFQCTRDITIRAAEYPQKLLMDAIIAGTTDACYDGVAFFATTHAESGSNQSNLLTGNGGDTAANIITDYKLAEAALLGFTDDQGEPIHPTDIDVNLIILAPTTLKGLFREILKSTQISGSSNTLYDAARLITSPRLDANSTVDWYLASVGGVVKPFIRQDRRSPRFDAQEGNSHSGFINNMWRYKVSMRTRVGYGYWQKMIKVNN